VLGSPKKTRHFISPWVHASQTLVQQLRGSDTSLREFTKMAECSNRDWKTIAKLAAAEQDPRKLFELVTELNKILEEEERRIQGKPVSNRGT
jgi:hypothetical protein